MLYDVIDASKHKTGLKGSKELINSLPKNKFFLVVRIWVKTFHDTVLFIKRLPNETDALLWENPGTLVASGASGTDEAIRELYDKSGILLNKDDLIYYGSDVDGPCIVETYGCKVKAPIVYLQEDKICDAQFIPIDNIKESKDCITKNAWNNYVLHEKAIKAL